MIVGTWNLENLFRPGGDAGPDSPDVYDAKLTALAATINAEAPDVLGVQEVGQPEALDDLVNRLDGTWHTALSTHFETPHTIRVGVLSRHPLQVVSDVVEFRPPSPPVWKNDAGDLSERMGRGVLAVQVDIDGTLITVVVCHLKSKLLSYPK